MKKYLLLLLSGVLALTGCGAPASQPSIEVLDGPAIQSTAIPSAEATGSSSAEPTPNRIAGSVTIGEQTFSAQFYDTETTRTLLNQVPVSFEMSELNGNEKYCDLPENLPFFATEQPAEMHAGEIMLWSANTLVLFYETFPNSFGGYVRLGYVEDPSGLAAALGTNGADVTFDWTAK